MSDTSPPDNRAVHASMVSGSFWMVAMRWCMRLIGVVSTVVLARLLAPEDFGLIAMSLIVYGMLELITLTGVDLAIIREANATDDHYHTAWTIKILQGLFLTLLLMLLAPLGASYFDEPRVVDVVRAMSIVAILTGVENIGVVAFRKELDFAKEFRFGVIKKLLTLFATIVLALTLRDYRALVGGMIVGSALGVILSYRMHPFRPKLSLSKFREIWGFSQWLLVSQIGQFLNLKTDQIVIGGFAGTEGIGRYHLATELATMPTTEAVMPMRRALYPTFAKLVDQPEEMRQTLRRLLGVVSIICIATGLGMSNVAHDLVYVLLGQKWMETAPLIVWLGILGISWAIAACFEVVLLVTGRARLAATLVWVQLAFMAPALFYVGTYADTVAIAMVRTAISILFIITLAIAIRTVVPLTLADICGAIWRPLLAGICMSAALQALPPFPELAPSLRLAMDVAVGACVYSITLLGLWWLSGRPTGAESSATEYVRTRLRQRKAAQQS